MYITHDPVLILTYTSVCYNKVNKDGLYIGMGNTVKMSFEKTNYRKLANVQNINDSEKYLTQMEFLEIAANISGFRCRFCEGSLMKVHYPKLYNMAHLLALNVSLLPKDLTIIFISPPPWGYRLVCYNQQPAKSND